MKPYLAILIDSFWEAVGNRVLWVLLVGWALVLAGLAPFGYVTERSFKLSSYDINNFEKIKEKLLDGANGNGNESNSRPIDRDRSAMPHSISPTIRLRALRNISRG